MRPGSVYLHRYLFGTDLLFTEPVVASFSVRLSVLSSTVCSLKVFSLVALGRLSVSEPSIPSRSRLKSKKFRWGILYSQIELVSLFFPKNRENPYMFTPRSIPLIFKSLHHFSDGQVGLAFLPMWLVQCSLVYCQAEYVLQYRCSNRFPVELLSREALLVCFARPPFDVLY